MTTHLKSLAPSAAFALQHGWIKPATPKPTAEHRFNKWVSNNLAAGLTCRGTVRKKKLKK